MALQQYVQTLAFGDLAYLAPELTLVIAAVVLALLGLFLPRKDHASLHGGLTVFALALSAVFVLWRMVDMSGIPEGGDGRLIQLLNESYRIDQFANVMKLILLSGTALVVLMSLGSVRREDISNTEEYYYLYLPAVLGAMVMVSAGDFITLFVGLELLSITSYVLVGIRRKQMQSSEGAFKYVVIGGISSAFILYGMSFFYGISGTTQISMIREELMASAYPFEAMIYVGFFLLFVGLAIKIAAAPFHTWAPDVYQGAPTPVTAFLAVVSKGAGLAILFRLTYSLFYGIGDSMPIHSDVFLTLLVTAAIAMVIGNMAALKQRNMKRLLAFSGVANAGYLLVPIGLELGGVHSSGVAEFMYYLIAYLFMNIGAFAVLAAVSRTEGHDEMDGFAGMYYRAPWTAAAMLLLLLSLAGIPVTGGFFGKLYIVWGAVQAHAYWVAAVMIVTSVISFYYYFSIARQMFMRGVSETRLEVTAPLGLVIWLCAAVSVLLGLFPGAVLRWLDAVVSLTVDLFIF